MLNKNETEMTDIKTRINSIREDMIKHSLDAYIILGTDPHMSEYIPDYWKSREWASGFTGSLGNLVITKNKAGLWTDSRYFIQAESQLRDSTIDLHKLRTEGYLSYNKWILTQLNEGSKIGIDGFNAGIEEVNNLQNSLKNNNHELVTNIDLVRDLWKDRPPMPDADIKNHNLEYAGISRLDKIENIRKEMKKEGAKHHLVASLDDIAWIMNIRGKDVDFNPVAISYLLISIEKTTLFINKNKLDKDIKTEFKKDNIEILEYSEITEYLYNIKKDSCFLIDPNRLNYCLYQIICSNHKFIKTENPSVLMKSIKNETEINGSKNACIKDGVALTKFWYWLEKNASEVHTELSIEKALRVFRAEQEDFVTESFHAIVAYGENAALPHYSANKDEYSELKNKGLLLIDSGGQYRDGTTDITRTMPLGKLSQEEKNDYTLVLRGMINLSMIKFPKGTRGCNIDFAARQPLWNAGLDYGHGTGHGVGSFLNVHEGPQSIRQEYKDQGIFEGMITSNEPGCYKEGRHGIRHENLILCVEDQKTEFGSFLGFETITMFYFDTSVLNLSLMTIEEVKWLNNYHKKVYKTLSPKLDEEHADWLKEKTKAIKK
jgi:Xaa-Pro aminopeptidase